MLETNDQRMKAALARAAAVRECFPNLEVSDREVGNLSYLITLADAGRSSKEFTHGNDHEQLRSAVRTILSIAPRMIAQSNTLAEAAAREARSTDFDHFSKCAENLLAAAKHFKGVSGRNSRSKRSWWHGWARSFALEVRLILHRNGISEPGFANSTGQGVRIILALFEMAAIEVSADALIDALKKSA